MACGTPVITFRTGGSVEAVSEGTGFVVDKGDINGLQRAVETIKRIGKDEFSPGCRDRAVMLYNKDERFAEYGDLYEEVIRPSA